jgi:hypothetical protein
MELLGPSQPFRDRETVSGTDFGDRMGVANARRYSGLMLANLITLAHSFQTNPILVAHFVAPGITPE